MVLEGNGTNIAPSKRKFLSYVPYIFSTHEDRIQLIFAIFLFLLAIINITPFIPSPRECVREWEYEAIWKVKRLENLVQQWVQIKNK